LRVELDRRHGFGRRMPGVHDELVREHGLLHAELRRQRLLRLVMQLGLRPATPGRPVADGEVMHQRLSAGQWRSKLRQV
jgi:hypothetical protein